ncbi:MAG TPA: ATP synthase F1 subunit epsilon [Verrucomicrobiales bacterium]|jgi:F-type H+-transporting ATPase subunit epsilon|nr:ATP synthase F1 subunit epsilon [Verrucomicrobiales bacterium]
MAFRLQIVTPEGSAFSDEVSDVVLPGGAGEMDVLPAHSNLVTTLVPGELRYHKDGHAHELAIGSGFAEIQGDHVNVLTDMAMRDTQIDEKAVEAALQRAQDRLKETASLGAEEVAAVEAAIANSLAQLKLKRKRRTL